MNRLIASSVIRPVTSDLESGLGMPGRGRSMPVLESLDVLGWSAQPGGGVRTPFTLNP